MLADPARIDRYTNISGFRPDLVLAAPFLQRKPYLTPGGSGRFG